MDREERIDWLCRLRTWLNNVGMHKEWREKFDQALADAIKESEQQPCEDEELDFVQPHKKIKVNLVKFDTPYTDTISRQAAIDAMREDTCWSCWDAKYILKHLPFVSTEKIRRCRDCKYFEYDSVAKVDGIPLIVAHEICSKWGDGCKTREDGYCFLFEPKEDEK